MREVKRYEALDGKLFLSETDCLDYEKDHPFLDHKEMEFYSLNGKRIKTPNESVFLDSNYLAIYSERALSYYQQYCERMNLRIPAWPDHKLQIPFPWHYCFNNGGWVCIEEEISKYNTMLNSNFNKEYEENEENYHNLVDCG